MNIKSLIAMGAVAILGSSLHTTVSDQDTSTAVNAHMLPMHEISPTPQGYDESYYTDPAVRPQPERVSHNLASEEIPLQGLEEQGKRHFALYCDGGNGGTEFHFVDKDYDQITGVQVRSGSYLDAIKVRIYDFQKKQKRKSFFFGGGGGSYASWNVNDGDWISEYDIRSGAWVDSIKFTTNKRVTSPQFGGNGGSLVTRSISGNTRFYGIQGRAGSYVNKLCMVYK